MPITPDVDRNAALVLADGTTFKGRGFGREGATVVEKLSLIRP